MKMLNVVWLMFVAIAALPGKFGEFMRLGLVSFVLSLAYAMPASATVNADVVTALGTALTDIASAGALVLAVVVGIMAIKWLIAVII